MSDPCLRLDADDRERTGLHDGKTEAPRPYEVTGTLSELDLASGKGGCQNRSG